MTSILRVIALLMMTRQAKSTLSECRAHALEFARNHSSGFQVGVNNALKRITAQLPALRQHLLADPALTPAERNATLQPVILDIGAASFGPPEYYSGSDSLLVLKQADVAVSVHAFEMQAAKASELRRDAALLLKRAVSGSTFHLHQVGIGSNSGALQASPMKGFKDSVRTLTLSGGDPGSSHTKRKNVFDTNVTSLDIWEAEQGFDRPIFYIKTDVNGHEPPVLQGATRLLRHRPPLFFSFEYSFGWNPVFGSITVMLTKGKRSPPINWPSPVSVTPNLHEFAGNLSARGYAVYLLHQRGLVRIDGQWWQDFYELELNPLVKAAAPVESWDFIAARHGAPQRALERLALFSTLPCLKIPGLGTRLLPFGTPGTDCKEQAPLADVLRPACTHALDRHAADH